MFVTSAEFSEDMSTADAVIRVEVNWPNMTADVAGIVKPSGCGLQQVFLILCIKLNSANNFASFFIYLASRACRSRFYNSASNICVWNCTNEGKNYQVLLPTRTHTHYFPSI
jgi:hypothetical protein